MAPGACHEARAAGSTPAIDRGSGRGDEVQILTRHLLQAAATFAPLNLDVSMQAASPDSLPSDSGAAPAEYARRLAFEPEEHTDFIFVIVGADGRDITGGVLLALALLGASAAVGIWIWRRQHRHPGP